MFPYCPPTHRRRKALNDECRKNHTVSVPGDAVAQLVVVSQAIDERLEAADLLKLPPRCNHDRATGKIDRLKTLSLQNLAPEIRINRNRFPAHRQCGRIGQAVEAVHQADGRERSG